MKGTSSWEAIWRGSPQTLAPEAFLDAAADPVTCGWNNCGIELLLSPHDQ